MDENSEKELNPGAVSAAGKSRKKDVTVYAKNPFWQATHVKIGTKKVTMAGGFVAKDDTGETISVAGVHRVEEVDEDQFVKLFTRNSALFFDLNKPAQKMLWFILLQLQSQPGRDGVWILWRDVEDWIQQKEITGLSRPNYHRAIAELLHKKLIAESDRTNFYWINPHVFFNGDRLVYIQEYRKVKKPKKLELTDGEQLERLGQQRLVE